MNTLNCYFYCSTIIIFKQHVIESAKGIHENRTLSTNLNNSDQKKGCITYYWRGKDTQLNCIIVKSQNFYY